MPRFGKFDPANAEAVLKAPLANDPTYCPFGHSFANHLLNSGHEIQKTQHLLEHNDVKTTMVDTHVLYSGGKRVRGFADAHNVRHPFLMRAIVSRKTNGIAARGEYHAD